MNGAPPRLTGRSQGPMTRAVAACIAGAYVGILATANASAAQERPDSVALRFGWAPGLTAQVEQEFFRVRRTPQRTDSVAFRSTSRMRVMPHEKGLLVVSDSIVVPGSVSSDSGGGAPMQKLLGALGALVPSYVVSAEGEFVEITDVAGLKRTMDSVFAPLLRDLGGVAPQAAGFMQQMLSEETLTASAVESWNAMVGTWIDADWEIGAVYELETEQPHPLLSGMTIPILLQFTAAERVPCTEREPDRNCVELQLLSVPDAEATKALTRKLLEQLGAAQAKEVVGALENMEVENEITVVVDPATLVPHLMVQEKRVRTVVKEAPEESGGVSTQVDRRTARFRYSR